MKIRKIGHCCLVIEDQGMKVLTDPGSYTTAQDQETGIDAIVITHEHSDHLHIDSLKRVLLNNPNVRVITNTSVGKLLVAEGITFEVVDGTNKTMIDELAIEAFDHRHEEIFEEMGQVHNTGYFIGQRLFYPGDSFAVPAKPVEILALPVAGPWCRLPDAIRYAIAVAPKKVFPVHEAMLKEGSIGLAHRIPGIVLPQSGIQFVALQAGDTAEF